MTIIFEGF